MCKNIIIHIQTMFIKIKLLGDCNIVSWRLSSFFLPSGWVQSQPVNSKLSSWTMLDSFSNLSETSITLILSQSSLICAPNTRRASLFSFPPTEKEGMIEGGITRAKAGRHSQWLCLVYSFFLGRPYVSCLQHDTSARLGCAAIEVCLYYCGVLW